MTKPDNSIPKAKEKTRTKLLEYLSDPDNPFRKWVDLCTNVCGYKNPRYLFQVFTREERYEIESEALTNRRKRYPRYSASVDQALVVKATKGDIPAISLFYERHEGWARKTKQELVGEGGGPLEIVFTPAKKPEQKEM